MGEGGKTVWDEIQEKRTAVQELKGIYQVKKKEFEADGVVTDAEKARLAQIANGINTASAKVDALEAKFKAEQALWEGRRKDLQALQRQIEDLFDWGEPAAKDVAAIEVESGRLARRMEWLNAIKQLDKAQIYIKPYYKEYEKQLPHRDDYNKRHDGIEQAGATHATSDFAKKDSLAKSLTAFGTTMKSAEEAATDRRYDDACRFLDNAEATAKDVGDEIKDLRIKHDECRNRIASTNGMAAMYATSKYKTVQEMNEKMATVNTGIGELMAAFEYDKALAAIEVNEKTLAQMKVEHEAKKKEEDEWNKQQPGLDEAKKKAEEVKEFGGKEAPPNVGAKADQAGQKATDEQFKDAAKTAEEAKAEADKAHAKMLEQKKKKEEAAAELSDIDKKLEALLASI